MTIEEEQANEIKRLETDRNRLRAENESLKKENWEHIARGYTLINMLPDETLVGDIQTARRNIGGVVDSLRAENEKLREENDAWQMDGASCANEVKYLRAELAAVTKERDRLQIMHDSAYISGMKHGWNCCAAGEEERYKNSIENIREQIRRARAALEGVTEKSGAGNE